MVGEVKDSAVAKVRVGFDGRVHKWYRGPLAKERFENEAHVLHYLEKQGCEFVPKVLEKKEDDLYLVTSNCGTRVEKLSDEKQEALFSELEDHGVKHNDQALRNITYNAKLGRFCLIDFEFATILSTGEGITVEEADAEHKRLKELAKESAISNPPSQVDE
jgi:predicted Ser/Thr protein kinase